MLMPVNNIFCFGFLFQIVSCWAVNRLAEQTGKKIIPARIVISSRKSNVITIQVRPKIY